MRAAEVGRGFRCGHGTRPRSRTSLAFRVEPTPDPMPGSAATRPAIRPASAWPSGAAEHEGLEEAAVLGRGLERADRPGRAGELAPRETLGARGRGEAALGLLGEEPDVALLEREHEVHDGLQGGGRRGELAVGGAHDPLVDQAGRDMGCDELRAGEPGGDRATNRPATFGPLGERLAHAAGVRIRERLARGLEHVVEGVGDPEPLERPGGEERGDARVLVRRGDEQVAHALHRRAFEVAQDPDEARRVGGAAGPWRARSRSSSERWLPRAVRANSRTSNSGAVVAGRRVVGGSHEQGPSWPGRSATCGETVLSCTVS